MRYEVNADLFEGPLPLLVELAKLNLLDLFIVKLQALTQQYLTLVKTGRSSLNELAEPLPFLGQLVAMKARRLLPQPPAVEEGEAPISLEELERRLREYEQFKTVAQVLAELHALQHEHFTHMRAHGSSELTEHEASEQALPLPACPSPIEAGREVGIIDLMTAFARVLEKAKTSVYEVEQDTWTVEQKVEELRLLLAVRRKVQFQELFSSGKTRLELVVTFLALLELVRQRHCLAVQERAFGEIVIVRRDSEVR